MQLGHEHLLAFPGLAAFMAPATFARSKNPVGALP